MYVVPNVEVEVDSNEDIKTSGNRCCTVAAVYRSQETPPGRDGGVQLRDTVKRDTQLYIGQGLNCG